MMKVFLAVLFALAPLAVPRRLVSGKSYKTADTLAAETLSRVFT